MMKEKDKFNANELAGFIAVGLTLFGCYTLWRVFGDVADREGHKLIEAFSTTLQWALWLTPIVLVATCIGILVWMLMPRIGEWTVSKAEAKLTNKKASRDIVTGFGGSETLVRYNRDGSMTVYDHANALADKMTELGQKIDDLGQILPGMAAIIQPSAASKIGRIENNYGGDNALLPKPLPRLSNLLPKAQRILITGGQNAGKTTVCQWIAYYKLQVGKVIVIDSHATPSRWPNGCEVIGAGRDYDKIERLLQWLMKEMDRRFKEQAQGIVPERGHEIISIVSDEWTLLPEVIKDVERYTGPLLTETRKAGFDFYLAAHDTTVDALGIKGKSGLRKAFDFVVLCDYDIRNDDHHTYVNFMRNGRIVEKDNEEYESLGPFVIEGQATSVHPFMPDGIPKFDVPEGDVWDYSQAEDEHEPTEDEQRIIDAVKDAKAEDGKLVLSHVTEKLGWTATGPNYQRIKNVLEKYKIDV